MSQRENTQHNAREREYNYIFGCVLYIEIAYYYTIIYSTEPSDIPAKIILLD